MQTTQSPQQLATDSAQKMIQYPFVGGGFIVFGFGLMLFFVTPELVAFLNTSALGVLTTPTWVIPTLGIGIAMNACALGWVAIARFLKEVHVAPYPWIAPFLGLVAGVLMASTKAVLPFAFKPLPFAIVAILVILAGGALSSMRRVSHKIYGVTLCVLPTGFLLTILAAQKGGIGTALAQTDPETRLFLFVLIVTSLFISALPFLPDSSSTVATKLQENLKETRRRLSLSEQEQNKLVAERDQLLSERAVFNQASEHLRIERENLQLQAGRLEAERAQSEHLTAAKLTINQEDVFEAAILRRRGLSAWMKWALAGGLFGGLIVVGYLQIYRPMMVRQTALSRALMESRQKYAGVLAKMKQEHDAERARTEATIAEQRDELAKARKQVVEAMSSQVAETETPPSAQSRQAAKIESEASAKTKTVQRASVSKVARPRARAKAARAPARASSTKPTKPASSAVPTGDDPLSGLEGM